MEINHLPKQHLWEQIFPKRPFPVMANRHPITGDCARHSHDFIELVIVTSGTGRHLTLYGDEPLQAGRGLVIHPGTWHAYHSCEQMVIYNCCFRLELLQHEFIWGQDDSALQALLWPGSPFQEKASLHRLSLSPEQVTLCQSHLENLISLDAQQNLIKVRHLGHFLLFLATFAHPLEQVRLGKESPHSAVQQSIQLLEDDLAFPWTLSEVACQVGIDPSYLVRLFNAHLNTSPIAYLARKRVEQAASLLIQTDLTICQIAQQTGWPDANHFARRFKAHMGVSATQYRAMCTRTLVQQDRTHVG
jgi:AraC family L-rhamnose operon transcriptional activator RhaR